MKKTISLALAALLLLSLCACGGKKAVDPGLDAVAAKVDAAVGESGSMTAVDADYIANSLGVAADAYKAAVVKVTNVGTSIDEYGVFQCADAQSAQTAETALKAYIQQRIDTWMGYTPEELPKLQNAETGVTGSYAYYFILGDDARAAAKTALQSCFEG